MGKLLEEKIKIMEEKIRKIFEENKYKFTSILTHPNVTFIYLEIPKVESDVKHRDQYYNTSLIISKILPEFFPKIPFLKGRYNDSIRDVDINPHFDGIIWYVDSVSNQKTIIKINVDKTTDELKKILIEYNKPKKLSEEILKKKWEEFKFSPYMEKSTIVINNLCKQCDYCGEAYVVFQRTSGTKKYCPFCKVEVD